MASISLYYDGRRLRKDGTAPIRLSIRFNGKALMIATDVAVRPGEWDKRMSRIVNHPRRKQLNSYLDAMRLNAEQVMREMKMKGIPYTIEMIRSRIIDDKKMEDKVTFLSLFNRVAEDSRLKERTREIYRATIVKLEAYAAHVGILAEQWEFEDIGKAWLSSFDKWLANTSPSKNARNIHLRNIRHVCNVALDEGLTTFYGFRGFSIKAAPTVKRSLPVTKLRSFFAIQPKPHQQKYLDCFKLIFFLIGINTIDLCHLKKDDYKDGRIEYKRSKTGRDYSVKVEKEAEAIIEAYKGNGEWLLDILDRYANFKDYAHRLNENLQAMGASLCPDITTYWARHSWATIAASLDIPIETIAAALGHGYGNQITAIYINFEQSKVDDANRKVIDWVLYKKK